MNPQPIIERLRSSNTSLKRVDGAVEYLKGKHSTNTLPRAFVLPGGEQSDEQEPMSQWTQRWSILVAIRSQKDNRGEAAMDLADPVSEEIKKALFDFWIPGDDHDTPLIRTHGGYLPIEEDTNVVFWEEGFIVKFSERPYSPGCQTN